LPARVDNYPGKQTLSYGFGVKTLSIFVISIIAGAIPPACEISTGGDAGEFPDTVLAVVNGDPICTSDFDYVFIGLHHNQSARQKETFDYRKLLNKLVNDRLLIQEAVSLGFDADERLLKKLHEDKVKNAVRQYYRENFKPDMNMSRDAILEYFLANYYKMRIRTISLADSSAAIEIQQKIDAGAGMDSLARQSSLDMYRYRGGLQNLKYYADIEVELREKAAALRIGETCGPVPFRTGYTVIRLEERTPADLAELDIFNDKIEAVLKQRTMESASDKFMDSLFAEYPVREKAGVISRIVTDSAGVFTGRFGAGSADIALYVNDDHFMTDSKVRKTISHMAMTSANNPFGILIADGIKKAKEELVLEAAALSRGYLDNPVVLDKYLHSMDSALIEVYLQETVMPQIFFKRDEFESYYDEHKEDFMGPREYKLDELIIPDESTALEIERALREGADFDYLVRRYNLEFSSEDAKQRWVTMAYYPESIREDVEKLKIGGSTPAYPTGDGWLILKIRDSRPGKIMSIEDADMRIREAIFRLKFSELLDKVLGILKENSSVIYNQEGIEEYIGGKKM